MALSPQFVLNVAAVEVKYRKGMVFLDRCGSIMVRLEEALGAAFEGTVPTMDHGDLINVAERMTVRYGQLAFSTTQNWVQSAVRLEHVAPAAWEHVGEMMGVNRQVTRCGVRFQVMWKVDDADEGERRLLQAGLFQETPDWAPLFGAPKGRGWSATTESREGKLRVGLNVTTLEIKGILSADLEGIVPKTAILLDLDYEHPGEPTYALHKGQMKDFIRASWERTKKSAAEVHSRLMASS